MTVAGPTPGALLLQTQIRLRSRWFVKLSDQLAELSSRRFNQTKAPLLRLEPRRLITIEQRF